MKKKFNIKQKAGIKLDIGCGSNKQPGFVGMDIRNVDGVDIVHDCEVLPYPLPDESCNVILMSHIMEHLCPKRVFRIMDELWRIMKPEGQLLIGMPYASSQGFWQDPSHCHSWNEATVYYFDPYPSSFNGERSTLYDIYRAKPWKIERNNWYPTGNLEIILLKRSLDEAKKN